MSDLPVRFQEADRIRSLTQQVFSSGGGSVGVSDGTVEIEVDDVIRIRMGLLASGSVGIQFYDQDGNVKRTITEGGG